MTSEQAKAEVWKTWSHYERAVFQLNERFLCMPWSVFQEAVGEALDRSVYSHEFAKPKDLIAELCGDKTPPTMDDIIGMIPEEKRIILNLGGKEENPADS